MKSMASSMRLFAMNNVNVIKALPERILKTKPKKVVGYARVSTDTFDQDSSYALQIKELEHNIKSNPNNQFLGIFKDKASGTSIKNRPEFKMMIELARKKEIDVIITKSISRFGRNLTETISLVRELRNIGVEIIFQKENILSLDDAFDFLFTILASHAEEESKNISENNRWTISKRKRNGDNLTNQIYGYKIINKTFHIIEDEAKVIRMIYDLYIKGYSYPCIINHLHELGIKTRKGNDYFCKATIEGILKNEKFCGDMILGKYYVKNGVKTANNGGLTDLILVENNHEGIISKETFIQAQKMRISRGKHKPGISDNRLSPYAKFVYSTVNEHYLRYTTERPKGRSGLVTSVIPTLYCSGNKPGHKRVSLQVKVIMDLLNQVIQKIKKPFLLLSLQTLNDLNHMINNIDIENNAISDLFNPLAKKMKLKDKLEKLNAIRKLLSTQNIFDIEAFRQVFRKIIINEDSIAIKISLSDDESIDFKHYELIHQTSFAYKRFSKEITYFVSVYFEGSFI